MPAPNVAARSGLYVRTMNSQSPRLLRAQPKRRVNPWLPRLQCHLFSSVRLRQQCGRSGTAVSRTLFLKIHGLLVWWWVTAGDGCIQVILVAHSADGLALVA